MKVKREIEIDTNYFHVGDRIKVQKYTATCQKVTKKKAIFLLDQYLDKIYSMNETNTNDGGYEESNLRKELQKEEILDIFSSIQDMMIPFKNGDLLRIPYAEELFGEDDYYEISGEKQWILMKDRRNRIASREGKGYEWGWLQNKVKSYTSIFTIVGKNGLVNCYSASGSSGVRPVFLLKK